jgi:hypothetical protein
MKALAETSPDPGHYNGRGPDLPGTPQRINNISPENWAVNGQPSTNLPPVR